MARVQLDDITEGRDGRPLAGVTVQINKHSDGSSATLYVAESGAATLPNPLTSDALGRFSAYVDPGSYDVVATAGRRTERHTVEAVSSAPTGGGGSITGWLDVTAYGAVGDNVADDTAAIAAAIADAKAAHGGVIWFPAGRIYKITATLDCSDLQGVTFLGGNGGFASNDTKPVLNFTGGAGAGPLLKLFSTFGTLIRGLMFQYSNELYDGSLLSFDWSATLGADCGRNRIENCGFYSTTASFNAASYISLNAFINGAIEGCDFQRVKRAIIFGNPAGAGGQYVVTTEVRDCSFARCISAPIWFRGGDTENCSFDNCSFEPLVGGKCGAFEQTSGIIYGPVFKSIWIGDTGAAGGVAFKGMATAANHGTIIGGRIADIGGAGSIAFDLKGDWTLIGVGVEGSAGSFIFADPGASFLSLNLLGGGANTSGAIWQAAGGAPTTLFAQNFASIPDRRPAVAKSVSTRTSFSPNAPALTDMGGLILIARGGAGVTFDIPNDATLNLPIGYSVTVVQEGSSGAGTVTVTLGVGVTLRGGYTTLASGGSATFYKIAANKWAAEGAVS